MIVASGRPLTQQHAREVNAVRVAHGEIHDFPAPEANEIVTLRQLQSIFGSERKDTTSRAYRAALSDLEKLQKQKAKRRVLESRGVYSIGRYGGWTYCSIEDNVVEARALADALTIPWRA